MTPFPWDAAMRFGLGVLRLPPGAFWSMTPRELAAAWGAVVGDGGPLPRSALDGLMERSPMVDNLFPDSFTNELDDVSLELERIGDLADGVARSINTAFRGALVDGKSFRSLLGDIAQSFADIALKAAIQPLGNLVGGLVENLFTATNPVLAGVTPFAKGGVIATPSYFPMGAGRLGLMGEAGAEAIMPLARGPDGRLGVAGGGGGGVQVTFNVTASDARSFARSEAELSAMLLRAVKRGTRGS